MGASLLQQVLEAASVHFQADGSAPHGILSNTTQHVGIDITQKIH
jgi:hypothetical protein